MAVIRLQKIIADRGYCSRRHAEELIEQGKVLVDGIKVVSLGSKFEEDTVCVVVEGKTLPPKEKNKKFSYLLLNKPCGYITTLHDDRGRKTIDMLVPKSYGRLFPVGRLDINTSGAIIMTDDGEFANLVMHPSSSFPKTYRVEIDGVLTGEQRQKLKSGVMLDDGLTAPAQVVVKAMYPERTIFELTIHEGRNRQVRRMVEAIDHKTISLQRVAIGPIKLGDLKSGSYRELSEEIVSQIRYLCLRNKQTNYFRLNRKE